MNTRPLRVVHCLEGRPETHAFNGVNKSVYHLSAAQAGLGLAVTVLSFDRDGPLPVPGVATRTVPRFWNPLRLSHAAASALIAAAPDVVHLHSPYFPEHAAIAAWARRRGIPYVVTPHGALSPGELGHRSALKVPYKYLFERRILNGAAFVHAVGNREQLEAYGVRAPVVVVPNGVEVAGSLGSVDGGAFRRQHPALAGKRVFLYVGRLDPLQKGLDLLIDAAARAALPDVAIVISGQDWRGWRARLERIVAMRAGAATVVLTGPLVGDEKLQALAAAEAFLLCSRWEGLPHAVLEAAAYGVPCLVTEHADPLGRFGATGSAVVVTPEVEAIAAGLRRMAEMGEGERREIGRRGRELVMAELTWRRVAEQLGEAYRRLPATRVLEVPLRG